MVHTIGMAIIFIELFLFILSLHSLRIAYALNPIESLGKKIFKCGFILKLSSVFFLCFGLCIGLFIIFDKASVQPFSGRLILGLSLIGFFAILPLLLLLETFFTKIEISGNEIIALSFWHKPKRIPLNDVISIDYLTSLKSFRMKTKNQGTVRLELYLRGLKELFSVIKNETGIVPKMGKFRGNSGDTYLIDFM